MNNNTTADQGSTDASATGNVHPDAQYLATCYTYHAPKGDQPERYGAIRDMAREMAREILTCSAPSRERSLALTKLEEAVFWANAGIARNG